MNSLTQKQLAIFNFLKKEITAKGYPPSIREICVAVGLTSTSTVHAHLKTLEKKGYIRRDSTKNRAIEIMKQTEEATNEFIHVPIIGKVTAGVPILAVENIEDTFPIPVQYAHNDDLFMLKVIGDSMIGAGIYHNDLILIRQQQSADNGDIVVALLDDSVTVKRFFKENQYIRLQPENSAYMPIIVDTVRIVGKVTGLFRKF